MPPENSSTGQLSAQADIEPGTYLLHAVGDTRLPELSVRRYQLNVDGGLDTDVDRQKFTGSAAYWLDRTHGTPVGIASTSKLEVASLTELDRSVEVWNRRVTPELLGSDTVRADTESGNSTIKTVVQSALRRAIATDTYACNRLDDIVTREPVFGGGEDRDFEALRKYECKVDIAADGTVLLHVESGYRLRATTTIADQYDPGDDLPQMTVRHDTSRYDKQGSGTLSGWSSKHYTDHVSSMGGSIAENHEGKIDEGWRKELIKEDPQLVTVEYGNTTGHQLPHVLKLSPRTEQVEAEDHRFHSQFTNRRAMKPSERFENAKQFVDDLSPLPGVDVTFRPGPSNRGFEFVQIRERAHPLIYGNGNRGRDPSDDLAEFGVYRSPGNYEIAVVTPERFENLREEFIPLLVKGLRSLNAAGTPRSYEYELGPVSNYTGVYQDFRADPDIVVAIVPNEGSTDNFSGIEDPFHELKRALMRQGYPTQMIEKSTVEDLVKGNASPSHKSFINILSAVVAKGGGTPWQVAEMPGDTDVFMGLDVSYDRSTGQHAGASASVVLADGTTYAAESATQQSGEKFVSDQVEQFVRDLVHDFIEQRGKSPEHVTIVRDGKVEEEIDAIRDGLSVLSTDLDIMGVRKSGQPRVAEYNGTKFEIADKGVAFVAEDRDQSILHSFGQPELTDDNQVGTPRPLRVVKHSGPTDIETLTRQAYWLSEVHVGSPARSTKSPVPIKYADMAADYVQKGFVDSGEVIHGPAYL